MHSAETNGARRHMPRIAIAKYGQETSSFSKVPTTIDTFWMYGLYEGDEILEKWDGVGSTGGFIQVIKEQIPDVTLIPIISGWAGASGIISSEALAYFEKKIIDGLAGAGPLDAVYLDLHGAGQVENEPDSEGYLLKKVREFVGPDVPIVASYDHHANMTQLMIDCMDGVVGHRDQPHRPNDTGKLAGAMLASILKGAIQPEIAWRRIPMLTHQEQYLTTEPGPMKEWFDLAREMETRPGVVSASTFPVQPWLDVPDCGWAAVVVTDGDRELAEQLADELAESAWQRRERFWEFDSIPTADAVSRAIAADRGLVILSDTGDSVFGGATGDSTHILRELLRQEVPELAFLPITDGEVVAAAQSAGVGATISVSLGGKMDPLSGPPLDVTARVAGLGGGRINTEIVGMESFDMGDAALLEIDNVRAVVSTKRAIGGNHPIVYQHFGLDPADAKIVVVKTASNWQYFDAWISEVIRVNTPGATMSELKSFDWRLLTRPMYPFDEVDHWSVTKRS